MLLLSFPNSISFQSFHDLKLASGIVAHTYRKKKPSTYTDKFLPEIIAFLLPQLFIFCFSLQRFPQKLSNWQKSRWQILTPAKRWKKWRRRRRVLCGNSVEGGGIVLLWRLLGRSEAGYEENKKNAEAIRKERQTQTERDQRKAIYALTVPHH